MVSVCQAIRYRGNSDHTGSNSKVRRQWSSSSPGSRSPVKPPRKAWLDMWHTKRCYDQLSHRVSCSLQTRYRGLRDVQEWCMREDIKSQVFGGQDVLQLALAKTSGAGNCRLQLSATLHLAFLRRPSTRPQRRPDDDEPCGALALFRSKDNVMERVDFKPLPAGESLSAQSFRLDLQNSRRHSADVRDARYVLTITLPPPYRSLPHDFDIDSDSVAAFGVTPLGLHADCEVEFSVKDISEGFLLRNLVPQICR